MELASIQRKKKIRFLFSDKYKIIKVKTSLNLPRLYDSTELTLRWISKLTQKKIRSNSNNEIDYVQTSWNHTVTIRQWNQQSMQSKTSSIPG